MRKTFPANDQKAGKIGSRRKRLLPLLLLASMLAIGAVLEPLRYGELLWAPKMPLAFLLAWALLRPEGR